MNRERVLLAAAPLGLIPVGLAVIAVMARPDGAAGTLLHVALWAALLLPIAVALNAAIAGGPWALIDLFFASLGLIIASAVLARTPYPALRWVYLVPPAIGGVGTIALVIHARFSDRSARAKAAREEAVRELRRMHWRLFVKPDAVTDAEIDSVLAAYFGGLPADPRMRVACMLGAIAPVCARRPRITTAMLERAAEQLRAAGFSDENSLLEWVQNEVAISPDVETDDAGRRWLRETLPLRRDELQAAVGRR